MMRKLGLAALLLVFSSVAALAADFNGKWNGQVQGRNGMQTLVFDFHVDGSTLTGKITTPRGDSDITDGKVDGDNISFTQKLSFNGNDITITYTGKVDGDSIQFTRQFGAAGDRPPQQFTAKRGDAPAPAPAAPQQ
jgi:opacity protein-like surface antigen